jgi:hypothetical protein
VTAPLEPVRSIAALCCPSQSPRFPSVLKKYVSPAPRKITIIDACVMR